MNDAEITTILDTFPDKVAEALERFRTAGVEKDRVYARAYLEFKARSAGEKITASEIESMVKADQRYYEAALDEITAESGYVKAHERLMAAKKQASMRAAF
jgi:hypothetical protein